MGDGDGQKFHKNHGRHLWTVPSSVAIGIPINFVIFSEIYCGQAGVRIPRNVRMNIMSQKSLAYELHKAWC